jgi:hypothetical protein
MGSTGFRHLVLQHLAPSFALDNPTPISYKLGFPIPWLPKRRTLGSSHLKFLSPKMLQI